MRALVVDHGSPGHLALTEVPAPRPAAHGDLRTVVHEVLPLDRAVSAHRATS